MKKQNLLKLASLFLVLFVVFSCKDENQITGKWDDNIKLSKKNFKIDFKEQLILVKTKYKGWWISSISFNKKQVNFQDIKTNTENFIIKQPEFKIERKKGTEIHIKISENKTVKERTLGITLQNGNYFDYITINQTK